MLSVENVTVAAKASAVQPEAWPATAARDAAAVGTTPLTPRLNAVIDAASTPALPSVVIDCHTTEQLLAPWVAFLIGTK